MVRIFAAGDFHGDKSIAKSLAEKAVREKADVIVLNGDIVEENKTEGIIYYFIKTGIPVFLVPGNHDWHAAEFLSAQYNVKNLHGKNHKFGNVGIVGCGGANVGFNMLTEREIYDTISKANETLKATKKLLVTHVHPSGSLMENFSDFVPGSRGLRDAIEAIKPDVVVCGHVHEAEGIEEKIGKTRVINVGKTGKLIEL